MRIRLAVLVISIFFNGCDSESKKAIGAHSDKFVDSINVALGSAKTLYDSAIREMNDGKPNEQIIEAYKEPIDSIRTTVARWMDSISVDFIRKEKKQSEYDNYIKSINTNMIKERHLELKRKGIEL